MKALVYDVETANNKNRGSICSVGWVALDNDVIVDRGYSLIDPHCYFSRMNTEVHGIRAVDVVGAPSFAKYWNDVLSPLMTSRLVIAHNAAFDMAATQQALFSAGIEDPGIDYLDSLALFRSMFDSPTYKLPDLAAVAKVDYLAHNAAEDALALAKVLHYIRDVFSYEDIASMIIRSPIRAENTKTNTYVPKATRSHPWTSSHCTEAVEAKGSGLADLRFCITGDVPGYERADLERMIMENGGTVCAAVSGKLNYLVVGTYQNYPADYISTKHRKALDLIQAGKNICILSPEEFMALMEKVASHE